MKFTINLSDKTLYTFMRSCGYAPAYSSGGADESVFQRLLGGREYPKFHAYCAQDDKSIILSLHLDQKKPSYEGSHAHNAEHTGSVVESEVKRIQSLSLI